MSKYTNHKHTWKVEYNTNGLFSVKCKQCPITVELYSTHIALNDYINEDDGIFRHKSLYYDTLLPVA